MMLISRPFAWYTKAYYSHFHNKKRSYYEGFYTVVNVDQLLVDAMPKMGGFLRTDSLIQIFNLPFDATAAMVIKRLGAPSFRRTMSEHALLERSTLFYKRPFFSDKAIFQFNFMNDLYLSCTVTFIQEGKSAERLFLQIVAEKYGVGGRQKYGLGSGQKSGVCGAEEFEGIVDLEGNLLLYEESVYSSLVYVNAAAVHRNALREVEEKIKQLNRLQWKKEYQAWSEQL
jgi:hypothetical protein